MSNLNLLTYVGIHELAHIMSVEIGHANEFKQNFKFLLDYTRNINYYDYLLKKEVPLYVDLNNLNTPNDFCGVSIVNSMS
jgi:predicted metal-dependent hydrolase